MRSRYSAYALGDEDYLLRTWHPATCPDRLGLDENAPVKWLGLKILETRAGGPGDTEGTVEFVARYKVRGRATRLHERSAFEQVEGKWLYVGAESAR
jgi:SEC-C motif-containing protein